MKRQILGTDPLFLLTREEALAVYKAMVIVGNNPPFTIGLHPDAGQGRRALIAMREYEVVPHVRTVFDALVFAARHASV